MSALLELSGLSKRFGALQALDAVSLEIAPGEVHCLLGENGAGKSTLCNAIFGVLQPDAGRMLLSGADYAPSGPADALRHGVAMVHQHFSLVDDLSVVDNLLLGTGRGLLRRAECADALSALCAQFGLQVEPYAKPMDLSMGERQRVEIVKCLMRRPRLLVLDEPTAVLLPDEIAALLDVCGRVAAEGCSVVLVTHKLAEIQRAAHRATVLRGGRVVARSDAPAAEIDRLVSAMIQRELKATNEGTPREAVPANAPPLLEVEGLRFDDAHGVSRLDGVSLQVRRGEIVGIAGVEGNGQTELGAVLGGMLHPSAGGFSVQGRALAGREPGEVTRAGVGIVPEDRHEVGCILSMSVADNLFLNQMKPFFRFGLIDREKQRDAARARMAAFDVRASGPDAPFSSLSGGNQQKAVLARELNVPGLAVLVAAQPTRGLDVGAVEAVHERLRAAARAGVAVLMISSELDDLLAVADRILVMFRGRITGECPAHPTQRERLGALMAGHA